MARPEGDRVAVALEHGHLGEVHLGELGVDLAAMPMLDEAITRDLTAADLPGTQPASAEASITSKLSRVGRHRRRATTATVSSITTTV